MATVQAARHLLKVIMGHMSHVLSEALDNAQYPFSSGNPTPQEEQWALVWERTGVSSGCLRAARPLRVLAAGAVAFVAPERACARVVRVTGADGSASPCSSVAAEPDCNYQTVVPCAV